MLEWIISSTALTLIVILLRAVLKGKMSLRLQYALWALVLVRLLVPLSFGSTELSVQNVIDRPAVEAPQTAYPAENAMQNSIPISAPISADTDQTPVYHPQNPYAGNQNVRQSAPVSVPQNQPAQSTAVIPPAETAGEAPAEKARLTVTDVLTIVWISGAGLVALWLLIANLQFYRKLRRSRTPLEGEHAPLPVYVTDKIDTPCLFGLIKPKIYVTPEVVEDETALGYSIEHEATHRRHGDHLWSLLRGACLAVHWYNPLVWVAAILSRSDAELACDEATIKRIGEEHRAEYGRTLIRLTCEKRSAIFVAATTMTGSGRGIKERIKLIVRKPKTAVITLIAIVLVIAIAVGCTFTGAKTESDEPTTPTEDAETTEPTTEPTTERAKLEASDLPALFDAIDLQEATLTITSFSRSGRGEDTAYPAGAAICAETYLEELKQYTWQPYPGDNLAERFADDPYYRLASPHTTITFYISGNKPVHIETDGAEGWFMPPEPEDDATWSDASYRIYLWYEEAEGATLFGDEGRLLTAEELEYFRDYIASHLLLTSHFNDVRDMNAWYFLHYFDGERFEPRNEAEQRIATQIKDWSGKCQDYTSELSVTVIRIPRADVDAYLTKYAGVTVEDMHADWFEEVTYLPETDCFYISGAYFGPSIFHPSVGVRNGSTVTLWERGLMLDAPRSYDPFDRLTLEQHGDGWRIVSYTSEDACSTVIRNDDGPEITPRAAIESLFESGDASLTLWLADNTEWKTYPLEASYETHLLNIVDSFDWLPIDLIPFDGFELEAVSADGTKSVIFLPDSGADIMIYFENGTAAGAWSAYQPTDRYSAYLSFIWSVRSIYDSKEDGETLFTEHSFALDGMPEEIVEYFATTAFVEANNSLAPDSSYRMDDLEIAGWRLTQVSEDGTEVSGMLWYAYTARGSENIIGPDHEGSGEYAGKIVGSLIFALEKQEDGLWHLTLAVK